MASINEQAARWAVRADAGSLQPDEQRELDAWLGADPRHRGAYIRARAQWADLDRLAALHGPASQAAPREDYRAVSRRGLLAAGVATLAAVGGGLSWFVLRRAPASYASAIGEVRRISLEDGSTLLLNTATEVTVRFTDRQRSLHLIRGEALFEVAHDAARPFLVVANQTVVRAVGTAFAVRLESAQVDVTVTEGVVEVADAAAAGGPSGTGSPGSAGATRVSATQRIVIARTHLPELASIAPAEAERQLAWRQGLVSFNGESLQSAVAEINRHNRRQIVIEDPALAAKPIVGLFRATDLNGFSAAAAAALKATVSTDGDTIRLRPAAPPIQN